MGCSARAWTGPLYIMAVIAQSPLLCCPKDQALSTVLPSSRLPAAGLGVIWMDVADPRCTSPPAAMGLKRKTKQGPTGCILQDTR